MNVRKDYLYTNEHEWVKLDGEFVYLGISDYAQSELGEIVYVEFDKEVAESVDVGEEFGSLESTKSASPVYSPVSGEIVEINELVEDDSEIVNQSPYDDGWLIKIKYTNKDELENLMSSSAYEEFLNTL